MTEAQWGSLPFQEQIDFFQKKKLVPTERWADLWKDQHDGGFMVAKAMKAELLADLQAAVDKGISQGTTLAEFRRDFDAIVKKHGWSGWTGEGSEAGLAWRTRLIYETNLRASYQAGRWAQVEAIKARRPYLVYKHSDLSAHPRPLHQSWDGLIVAVDDPWVKTHWPPNGWGCRCKMFSLAERDLRRMGKSGPDTPPDNGAYEWTDKVTGEVHSVPKGIDPGWDYAPGQSRADVLKTALEGKAARMPAAIGERLARSLANESQPGAAIIDLSGVDVDTSDGIRDVLVALHVRSQDGLLPYGVKSVQIVRDLNVISDTNQRGRFGIGDVPLPSLGGRSGLDVMTTALAKIRDGKPLVFEEEYGLESLWHEILHNHQRHPIQPDTPAARIRLMEGLHQVLARQTYPKLLEALGIEPRFLRRVRENGPAYPKSAGGMTALLRAIGLMDENFILREDALANLQAIDLESPLKEIGDHLVSNLTASNRLDPDKLRKAVEKLQEGSPMTLEKLKQWLTP